MAKVTFVKPDGSQTVIEAQVGSTLMQAGIGNGINGIVAECGGCCQCATCHVYIAAEWRPRLPVVTESEEAMLDNTVCERLPESRLSCEIKVTAEMDGLVVHLPGATGLMAPTVAIAGAGLAGFQVASALREQGYQGRVVLVGEESHRPYHRPPLSKGYLLGAPDETALALRPEGYYLEKGIEFLASTRAVSIDRAHHRLALDNGSVVEFDHLVLAVGARNRPLHVPGCELNGVFFLRHLDEARALRSRMQHARRAVIVGAGFIGLEFAATAVKCGLEVTVLEVAERPMSRALSATMAHIFTREHTKAGIRFMFNNQVRRMLGAEGRVVSVETVAGVVIDADLVLIGIGIIPNVELAATCGLEVSNGILVDAHLRTSDPRISAVGDCACYPSSYAGDELVRLESVQNATDQARSVAARIMGKAVPYAAVPWFWSDQGPLKLQIAGLTATHDDVIVRGDPGGVSCSVFFFRAGRLLGVESVNRPGDHMSSRRLVGNRVSLTPAQAADQSLDLKSLAAAARMGS